MLNRRFHRNIFTILAVAVVGTTLSACSPSPEELAKIDRKMKHPDIITLGVFDGCVVKYVDRYYAQRSFYLARCGTTITQTTNYKVSTGRNSTRDETETHITHNTDEVPTPAEASTSKEQATPASEAAAEAVRRAALAKLTPVERAALGVAEPAVKK